MEDNEELRLAWEFVENTGKSIFLTGRAGTGKTTFLRSVVEKSTKRIIVVAPTGVAAINAGGVTIHSFFQLPPSLFIPETQVKAKYDFSKTKRRIINSLDLLIIDEISMVRSDLLDAVDYTLQRLRGSGLPFGGVQLLMIGDLQQLTPVVTRTEEPILARYYDSPYFFSSKALQRIDYVTIELKHVYRQQQGRFLDILNEIREGAPSDEALKSLNSRCNPAFVPAGDEGYIRLTTHNHLADSYNETELRKLPGGSVSIEAAIEGTFPETSYPTEPVLHLKVGAQVMFIKNDPNGNRLFYNGKIGRVTDIDDDGVYVSCPGDDDDIYVQPLRWDNTTYKLNEETKEIESKVLGTFTQIPLRLAWAITIHKSQGLTFDKAIIEADASFASGQVYVALSRCRSMEGLVLAAPIRREVVFNDSRVTDYISRQEEAAARSISRLPEITRQYYRSLLLDLFNLTDVVKGEQRLNRQFIEFFSHSHPRLTTLHKQTLQTLQQEVEVVSYKWKALITGMTDDEVHGETFLERVKRGCVFFADKMEETLRTPLHRCTDVKVGNKQAMQRLSAAYSDLQLSYLTKLHLLRFVADGGFTIASFLKYKQRAVLLAMEGREDADEEMSVVEKLRQKLRRKPKQPKQPKQPKPPKEDTKEVSLRMYREGMPVKKIAEERGFRESTIYGHLAYYVAQGLLPMNDFVNGDKLQAIKTAIAKVGRDNGLGAIKNECPPDVSYGEIRIVLGVV